MLSKVFMNSFWTNKIITHLKVNIQFKTIIMWLLFERGASRPGHVMNNKTIISYL